MKTFHVQLPFQAANESYPIHRAGNNIHLQFWYHLVHVSGAHFKRNQGTIRVLLKKKTAKKKNILH